MAAPKQQFNVYLGPELVRRIKHRAIDESTSLSALVSRLFESYLHEEPAMTELSTLTLQPLVRVSGPLADSVRFYEALGGTLVVGSRDGDYALMRIGAAEIGLLAHPPNPDEGGEFVELAFATERPLREVEADLRAAGVTIVRGAADEAFGEQLQVQAPDGMTIKINRLEPATFA